MITIRCLKAKFYKIFKIQLLRLIAKNIYFLAFIAFLSKQKNLFFRFYTAFGYRWCIISTFAAKIRNRKCLQ
jgi:hypothetical protein